MFDELPEEERRTFRLLSAIFVLLKREHLNAFPLIGHLLQENLLTPAEADWLRYHINAVIERSQRP